MGVAIRPARPIDDAPLRALDLATWSWEVSPGPPAPAGTPFFGARTEPVDVLVAVRDGAVCGYVSLGRPTHLPANRHVLAICGLAVHPAHRHRRIARRLLAAVVEAAGARGARRLTLRVLATNAPARRLYASCGFEIEGVLRGEFALDGRYVDDVLMALDPVPRPGG